MLGKIYSENGLLYTFDREYARSLVESAVSRANESRSGKETYRYHKKRFSKGNMYLIISQHLGYGEELIKKWFLRTKPSDPVDIETIHKLEKILGDALDRKVELLKPIESNKQEVIMSDTEKSSARELYLFLLNIIDNVIPAYKDFAQGNGKYEFLSGLDNRRYDSVMEIRRTAFDLPANLRLAAISLVNDVFGPESTEPDSFFETDDYKEFISSEEYKEYLEEEYPEGRDLSMDHLNYCEAKREEYFSRLDEIFSLYIRQ